MAGVYDAVAGFGHRELQDGDLVWRQQELVKACAWLRDAGTRFGISGLALGFDSDWAEAVLDAGLQLCVAIPFEGQDRRWNRKQKARYAALRAAAAREHVGNPVPGDLKPHQVGAVVNKRLWQRNAFMAEHATAGITDWEPGRLTGGTTGALLMAARRGLPGIHLDPVGRVVRFALPQAADLEAFALHATECGHAPIVGTRAQVDARLAGLRRAGLLDWRVLPLKEHERRDSCDGCLEELSIAAWSDAERVDALAGPLPPVP